MKEDEMVESFFKGMKEADEQVTVPEFPKLIKHPRRQLPVFLYAAATIAVIILAAMFFVYKNDGEEQSEQAFVLIDENDSNTNSLIEDESLSEWDSPTNFLAEDF